MKAAAWLGRRLAIAQIDALARCIETTSTGPRAQFVHGLRSRHGDGHDELGSLMQGDVKKRRESAARTNLGAGPVDAGAAVPIGPVAVFDAT